MPCTGENSQPSLKLSDEEIIIGKQLLLFVSLAILKGEPISFSQGVKTMLWLQEAWEQSI